MQETRPLAAPPTVLPNIHQIFGSSVSFQTLCAAKKIQILNSALRNPNGNTAHSKLFFYQKIF